MDYCIENLYVSSENISGKADGRFIDVQYAIPDELTAGKTRVKVEFQLHPGHRAGPLFAARIIKREIVSESTP